MINQALQEVQDLIIDVVQSEDEQRLAAVLAGRGIPCLGGNQHNTDIIIDSLAGVSTSLNIPSKLAQQAAILCRQKAEELKKRLKEWYDRGEGDNVIFSGGGDFYTFLDDETYLFNLFLLASYLPRTEALFLALVTFHEVELHRKLPAFGLCRSQRQLMDALTRQQTDGRLEKLWLSGLTLDQPRGLVLTDEQLDALLRAWRALLWIPPPEALCERGETVDLDRVEKGLIVIAHTMQGQPEKRGILEEVVLYQLDSTYGRTPEFWFDGFYFRMSSWPKNLVQAMANYWPIFLEKSGNEIEFSDEADAAVWKGLEEDTQNIILIEAEQNQWKTLTGLMFSAGDRVRRQILSIKLALELHFGLAKKSSSLGNSKRDKLLSKGEKNRSKKSETFVKKIPLKKGKKKSSRESFTRVQSVLDTIESRLNSRDFGNAETFLGDLLKKQREDGTEPALIAKTLCKAAAMATRFFRYSWAERLYKEAQGANPDDVVAQNGLAETLKSQGHYEEAEKLYRETAERWPDNDVAQNGLAETLKSQGHYEEAEKLYRETAKRWPENVIVWTGLAETLKSQGHYEEAEKLYRETAKRWSHDPVARHGLANLLRRRGGAYWIEALSLVPEPKHAEGEQAHYDLHLRGMILLESGEPQEATRLFERGLAVRTHKSEKLFQQGLVLAELKRQHFEEAAQKAVWMKESQDMDGKILYLHVLAAQNSKTLEVKRRYEALNQERDRLTIAELQTLECLIRTFYLAANDENTLPLDAEAHDQLVSLEVEMLLQAA